MSKRRRMMKRRRFVTVTVVFILMMTAMVNYAMAKRLEQENISVVVKNGESIWSIARENNPQNKDIRKLVYEIMEANNISDGRIFAGQELIIPIN